MMRIGERIWFCGLMAAMVLSSGCKKQPELDKPFVLTLQLAKREWRVGESPWYLLQAENVGSKERFLDPFWYDQSNFHADYRSKSGISGRDTYFEIVDPRGKVIVPECMDDWGMHGEFRFWANAEPDPKSIPLKPGKTFAATPTVVAPVRRQADRQGAAGPADARIPSDAGPEERKAYAQLWEQYKKELEQLGRANDFTLNPKVLYPGYRVLECYDLSRPGVYRMKAIMDKSRTPTPRSAEEDLALSAKRLGRPVGKRMEEYIRRGWAAKTPQELEQMRNERARDDQLAREHPETLPDFVLESNTVEIEMVP
jgi:hypothetical protein